VTSQSSDEEDEENDEEDESSEEEEEEEEDDVLSEQQSSEREIPKVEVVPVTSEPLDSSTNNQNDEVSEEEEEEEEDEEEDEEDDGNEDDSEDDDVEEAVEEEEEEKSVEVCERSDAISVETNEPTEAAVTSEEKKEKKEKKEEEDEVEKNGGEVIESVGADVIPIDQSTNDEIVRVTSQSSDEEDEENDEEDESSEEEEEEEEDDVLSEQQSSEREIPKVEVVPVTSEPLDSSTNNQNDEVSEEEEEEEEDEEEDEEDDGNEDDSEDDDVEEAVEEEEDLGSMDMKFSDVSETFSPAQKTSFGLTSSLPSLSPLSSTGSHLLVTLTPTSSTPVLSREPITPSTPLERYLQRSKEKLRQLSVSLSSQSTPLHLPVSSSHQQLQLLLTSPPRRFFPAPPEALLESTEGKEVQAVLYPTYDNTPSRWTMTPEKEERTKSVEEVLPLLKESFQDLLTHQGRERGDSDLSTTNSQSEDLIYRESHDTAASTKLTKASSGGANVLVSEIVDLLSQLDPALALDSPSQLLQREEEEREEVLENEADISLTSVRKPGFLKSKGFTKEEIAQIEEILDLLTILTSHGGDGGESLQKPSDAPSARNEEDNVMQRQWQLIDTMTQEKQKTSEEVLNTSLYVPHLNSLSMSSLTNHDFSESTSALNLTTNTLNLPDHAHAPHRVIIEEETIEVGASDVLESETENKVVKEENAPPSPSCSSSSDEEDANLHNIVATTSSPPPLFHRSFQHFLATSTPPLIAPMPMSDADVDGDSSVSSESVKSEEVQDDDDVRVIVTHRPFPPHSSPEVVSDTSCDVAVTGCSQSQISLVSSSPSSIPLNYTPSTPSLSFSPPPAATPIPITKPHQSPLTNLSPPPPAVTSASSLSISFTSPPGKMSEQIQHLLEHYRKAFSEEDSIDAFLPQSVSPSLPITSPVLSLSTSSPHLLASRLRSVSRTRSANSSGHRRGMLAENDENDENDPFHRLTSPPLPALVKFAKRKDASTSPFKDVDSRVARTPSTSFSRLLAFLAIAVITATTFYLSSLYCATSSSKEMVIVQRNHAIVNDSNGACIPSPVQPALLHSLHMKGDSITSKPSNAFGDNNDVKLQEKSNEKKNPDSETRLNPSNTEEIEDERAVDPPSEIEDERAVDPPSEIEDERAVDPPSEIEDERAVDPPSEIEDVATLPILLNESNLKDVAGAMTSSKTVLLSKSLRSSPKGWRSLVSSVKRGPKLAANLFIAFAKVSVKSLIKVVTLMPKEHQQILLSW